MSEAPLTDVERRVVRARARAATLDALRMLGGEARRTAIREHALAHGGFTPRELAAPPPDGAPPKYASFVEHCLSWTLTNLKRDGLVENPARSVWRLAGATVEPPPPAITQPLALDRLVQLRAMPYREYLRTPEWRKTRAAALHRAGDACSLDVTHTSDLEVHHRTYERLGAELPGDVVVLCRTCHRLHHREHGRPRKTRQTRVPAPTARGGHGRKPSLLRRLLAG